MGDFLKRMDWLGRDRATGYLWLLALLNGAMLVFLVATSHGGVDRNGFLLGSDFISFWTSGQMLHSGANVYDSAAHIAAQRRFFASAEGYTAFFYPPTFLPVCWPLGWLGYFSALAAWLLVTGALFLLAVRPWWRRAATGLPLWLLVLAYPAVPIMIDHGQSAFLVAGLLGLGTLLAGERPILAGVLFGLATIKPQFGPLIPLALLLTREMKVFLSAAVTALLLAGFSALVFGGGIWSEWLAASAQARSAMEAGAVPFGKMVSLFAAARLLGVPVAGAYALQAVAALGTVLCIALLCRRRKWSPGLGAAVLAGALLVTPFVLDYDLVLLAFPLLWLVGEGLRGGFRDWEKLGIVLTFVAPALARAVALNAGVPIMPPVLILLFALVARRLRRAA
ncbi:MAG: glycosyltransferase family 87 protein [Novosphingobium sp.]